MLPKIIAHRGHSSKYPENTLLAFKKAIGAGTDGFECDLHFTTDKKVVIHHYYTLGHTDNGNGYIFEKDSQYLRSLDCGSWFNSRFKNQKMPYLDELLTEFGSSTLYELELKDFGKEFADTVLHTVKKHNL